MPDILLQINNNISQLNEKLKRKEPLDNVDKAILNLLTADFNPLYSDDYYPSEETCNTLALYKANPSKEGLYLIDISNRPFSTSALVGTVKRACVESTQIVVTLLVGFSFIFLERSLYDKYKASTNFVENLCSTENAETVLNLIGNSIPNTVCQECINVYSSEDILNLYEDTMYGVIAVKNHFLIFAPKTVINNGEEETILICYDINKDNGDIHAVEILHTLNMYIS